MADCDCGLYLGDRVWQIVLNSHYVENHMGVHIGYCQGCYNTLVKNGMKDIDSSYNHARNIYRKQYRKGTNYLYKKQGVLYV